MDMELERVSLEGYRPVYDGMLSQEETLESIVPDALPDIARIVSATGRVDLRDKELIEGSLRLSGNAKVTVLYIPEGEDLPRTLEVSIPFQMARDDPKFHSGCPVQATIWASFADARLLNPRKVLARVSLNAWAAAYDRDQRELTRDAAGEVPLEKRTAAVNCQIIPQVAEKPFSFSDVLRPAASKPEIEELLYVRPELGAMDAKFIGKKLVLKGDVGLTALYRNGGELNTTRFELPYSQILDLGDSPDEADPEVRVALKNVDCQLRDGELEVMVEALAQAALGTQQPVSLLSDVYSTGQPVEVDRAPVRLVTMAERSSRREVARKLCESGIPARQVLDCWAATAALAPLPEEEGTGWTAQVNASVLYLSEDGALCGLDTTVPVSCRAELPKGCAWTCSCRPVGEAAAVPVTGGLEIRFEVEFLWTATREEEFPCVTALRPGAAPAQTDRPSVVIRRVGEGEALWDIAKSCNSTIADICGANSLAGETAPAGALLLVPIRRV